ncbi:hypothetical protein EIN_342690, partial [Entamoeba invadens IP1]
MPQLQSVFLKNVLLYLETLDDILNFMLVSRICNESVQTMYINSYKLSQHNAILDILDYFPSLETMFIDSPKTGISSAVGREIPTLEFTLLNPNYKLSKILTSKWLPSKLKRLKVVLHTFSDLPSDFSVYENLTEVSIDVLYIYQNNKQFIESILSQKSLKKVVLYFSYKFLVHLLDFDYSTRKDVHFTFVVNDENNYIGQKSTKPFDFKIIKLFPKNVNIFFTFLSNETADCVYVPFHSRPFYNKTLINQLRLIEDAANNTELVAKYLESTLIESVVMCNSAERRNIRYELKDPISANYFEFENVKEIEISDFMLDNFVLPKNTRKVCLKNVGGVLEMSKCKVESFEMTFCDLKSLVLDDEKITHFDIHNTEISLVHKSKNIVTLFILIWIKLKCLGFKTTLGIQM